MRTVLFLVALLLALPLSGCVGDRVDDPASDSQKLRGMSVLRQPFTPGNYRFDAAFSQVLVDGTLKMLPKEITFIKSKLDGVDIQFVTWRPDTTEPVPVIIQASPYYQDTANLAGLGRFITTNFVPHGYAYTQLAIRSTGDSGGCDDFRGPKMTADMSQAIDWLATQPWSNGNVGLIGISYVGTTPWYAAGSGNPHVKTIVPISGSTNAWEVYNRNGSSEGRSPLIIPNYGTSAAANPNRSAQHKLENFSCTSGDVHRAWAAGIYGGVMGDKEPFRDFWDARNVKPLVEKNYKGSVLVVHGFEDWNVDPAVVFPWTNHLNITLGLPVKTLVGQWAHTYPDTSRDDPQHKRWDWAETLLRWFDHWLKGRTQVDTGPWVQLQDNQLRWRNEDHYPPIDATWRRLHLASGGKLADAPGAQGSVRLVPVVGPTSGFRSMPGDLAWISTDFALPIQESDLRISGLPRVHVTVTPHGPGGYVAAWLLDVDPVAGTSKRIGWTSMNLRFHQGGDQTHVVVPERPIVAKMEIQPMDAVVPAGHQLTVRVWVNGHSDRQPSVPPTAIDLNWGGSSTSIVELPLIERPPEVFFEPPRPN